ncbi:MAG: molybdopterin molybdotransferase MoeA [Dehalobacterium sp.]
MYKKPDFTPTRNEMLRILEDNIKPLSNTETISLIAAAGRICAEEIYAKNNLPNKPVSACDGIMVRFADFEHGIPDTSSWQEGIEYSFSNTGVAICENYDTVIAIEGVKFGQDRKIILLDCPVKRGQYVGAVGGQVKEGELLATKGEILTPALIGILFTCGILNIKVFTKPKVAFIPTGDELVPAGFEIPLGKNVESNSFMLKAYIEECGGEAILYPIIQDKFEKIQEAILSAVQASNLVLICAGSSKGSKDFTMEILESIGNIIVHELGHGPGKHCSLTYVGDTPVVGLPGPPNGADLVSELYVKNTLRLMQMQPVQIPHTVEAVLTKDIKGRNFDFMEYIKVFIKNGQYYARPIVMQGKTRSELYHAHNARIYLKCKTVHKAGDVISAEMRCPLEYIREE